MQNLKQPKEENQQQQQTKHKFEATQRRKCINNSTQNTNLKQPKEENVSTSANKTQNLKQPKEENDQQQQQTKHKSEVTHRRKCINNSKQITKFEATQRRK
jgi:hypothetical protein